MRHLTFLCLGLPSWWPRPAALPDNARTPEHLYKMQESKALSEQGPPALRPLPPLLSSALPHTSFAQEHGPGKPPKCRSTVVGHPKILLMN